MGSAGECPDANVGKMWEFPAGWGCVGVEFFPFVWIFYTVGGVCLWIMMGCVCGKCLVFCGLAGCAGNRYKGHVFCRCFFIGTIINDLIQ